MRVARDPAEEHHACGPPSDAHEEAYAGGARGGLCRVRHRRALGVAPGLKLGLYSASLAPLRGYLLLCTGRAVAAYNASAGPQRNGPADVTAARLADLTMEIAGQVSSLPGLA